MRYFPGGCSRQVSMMACNTPHAFPMSRVICWASSAGLTCWTPRISWLLFSVGCFRDTYLNNYKDQVLQIHNVHWQCELPKLDEARSGQDGAHCPLGYLTAVVLQLCGQYSSSLRVQLLPPINTTRQLNHAQRTKLCTRTIMFQNYKCNTYWCEYHMHHVHVRIILTLQCNMIDDGLRLSP